MSDSNVQINFVMDVEKPLRIIKYTIATMEEIQEKFINRITAEQIEYDQCAYGL